MLDNQININSDSKLVAKITTVLTRFKVLLFLGMSATVVGNRLSNFVGNVSREMLQLAISIVIASAVLL